MDSEFFSWAKVILAVAFLSVLWMVSRDYHAARVEWHAGRVTKKEVFYYRRSVSWSPDLFGDRSCFISVDSGGTKGRVPVDRWTYTDWQVGQACEVASRHGHYMNYNFTDLRRPQRGSGKIF